ncbi:hypothetical protein PsAD13_05289 [Pseudovibrio sp. Ad13]|uniref:AAA family ATPase n=1 Tax=Pseudovibrio sp. Ad13 TaxID=989396 RepID=UPI0007AEC10D|nr:ATP-binding protein [Pseudovibrio sp. Ad13]KZK75851.1 hypothetical protein PsAD13_05289 [Pseudovibrio sp. Ad13]
MKFKFKDLGFISNAELEMGDLTIVSGPNNTGKTYLSYAIYGYLRSFLEHSVFSVDDKIIDELIDTQETIIDLSHYQELIDDYVSGANESFSSDLDSFFSVPEGFFEKSEVSLEIDDSEFNTDNKFNSGVRNRRGFSVLFTKEKGDSNLIITCEGDFKKNISKPGLKAQISRMIAKSIFDQGWGAPFVVTSERTGVALFYKELDISKNKLLSHIAESKELDPIEMLNSMRSRYATPIQDNIDVVRDFDQIVKSKSYLRRNANTYAPVLDALKDLVAGSFKNSDGMLQYKPRRRNSPQVPLYVASSSVKSLFLIDLYINYISLPGGLLIIDEPELNLHPDNQRKMARLITRLVNSGVKVLITTHSDFLIREFNNSVILSNDFEDKQKVMKKHKYISEDILSPKQVEAYSVSDKGILKKRA